MREQNVLCAIFTEFFDSLKIHSEGSRDADCLYLELMLSILLCIVRNLHTTTYVLDDAVRPLASQDIVPLAFQECSYLICT